MSVEEIIKRTGVMDIRIDDNVLNRPIRMDDHLREEVVRRFPAIAIYYLEKVRGHSSPGNRARLSRIALTSMVLREYWSNMSINPERAQNFFPLYELERTLRSIYLKTNGLYEVADQILKDKIVRKILGEARKQDWSRNDIIDYLGVGHNKEGLLPQLIKANVRYVFSKFCVVNGELTYKLVPKMDQSPKNARNNNCVLIQVRDISQEGTTPPGYAVISSSPLHLAQSNP